MTTDRRTFLTALGGAALLPTVVAARADTLSAQEALEGLNDGSLILVDIRRPEEWAQTGVAKGAWLLDMTHKDFGPRLLAVLERNAAHRVAIICRTGNRTGYLMNVLAENGISGVLDVTEGMVGGPNGKGWIALGLPLVSAQEAFDAMPKDLRAS